jgi:hypothetical protein
MFGVLMTLLSVAALAELTKSRGEAHVAALASRRI